MYYTPATFSPLPRTREYKRRSSASGGGRVQVLLPFRLVRNNTNHVSSPTENAIFFSIIILGTRKLMINTRAIVRVIVVVIFILFTA
jgi:hypothetical protein